jgi:hypothetical protein
MEKQTVKKCWNCIYKGDSFKIRKLTHHHCYSPTYENQHQQGIDVSPWETLRVFSDTCDEHKLKTK